MSSLHFNPNIDNVSNPLDAPLSERIKSRLLDMSSFPLIPTIDASTDPGDDNDDILKAVSAAFFQMTTFNQVASVVERAPSHERAKLLSGAYRFLGLNQIEIAVGSNYSYGSGPLHPLAQSMISNGDKTFIQSKDLLLECLKNARPRSLTLLAIGGLRDLAEMILLEPSLVQSKLARLVLMGGVQTLRDRLMEVEPGMFKSGLISDLNDPVYEQAFGKNWRRRHTQVEGFNDFTENVYLNENGMMTADNRAANNKFCYNSAAVVHTALQFYGVEMIVVTRNAANAMSFERGFYDELAEKTNNPVAVYLRDFQRDVLKHLWWRTWQEGLKREGLPSACNPDWFGQKFCAIDKFSTLVKDTDDPWEYVKKFAPYDVCTFFAADPRLRAQLYDSTPVVVGGQTHYVIGVSEKNHGIKDTQKAVQFMKNVVFGGLELSSKAKS